MAFTLGSAPLRFFSSTALRRSGRSSQSSSQAPRHQTIRQSSGLNNGRVTRGVRCMGEAFFFPSAHPYARTPCIFTPPGENRITPHGPHGCRSHTPCRTVGR